jgi:hypothetical protein
MLLLQLNRTFSSQHSYQRLKITLYDATQPYQFYLISLASDPRRNFYMPSLILLGLTGLVVAYAVHTYRCFARHLAEAKISGLPFIASPIYTFNRFWLVGISIGQNVLKDPQQHGLTVLSQQLTHPLWLPLLRKLPKRFSAWIP